MKFLILACSVCFGDPNSSMSRGAKAGAIFLLGVVLVVLTGIAWTAFSWLRREARIEKS